MIQDINEQLPLPEFTDNQEQLVGPSEQSLYDLDNVGKINTSIDTQDSSFMVDDKAKSVYDALSPIPKEEKITAYIDDKGKIYDEDSPVVKESAVQEKFPDPPTEEDKAKKKDELIKLMDEEIAGLDAKAQELIKSGEKRLTNPKRLQRWKEKETELIQFKYQKEYSDYAKDALKIYTKKNKTEKQTLSAINDVSKSLENKILNVNKAIGGLNFGNVSIYGKDDTNPELEIKNQETLNKGISTYEQFSDAFQKGKIPDGSVIRVYDAWGYRSNVMTNNAKPVYYQAYTTETGEKRIDKIADGYIDPITKKPYAVAPVSNLSAVNINVEFSAITDYDSRKNEITSRTDITDKEKAVKINELEQSRSKALSKLNAAYDAAMSPSSNLSKNVKIAIIASTFPNQFKERITESVSDEKSGETASDRVLNAFGGLLVSPLTTVTVAAGAAEKGVRELSRIAQGKPEGVLPTGTLALEIQKNPELAKAIDDVIIEAGDKANMYLNSVEGLANLVSAAKAKINNKDIDSIIKEATGIYPQIKETLQLFANTANRLKLNASAYEAGALRILNNSGYNAALKDFNNALNVLENSDNKDIRDAFRFIKLQSSMLQDGTAFSDNYAAAKPEDIEFINKVGKDLQLNKREILSSVYDEVEKLRALAERARGLFPTDELNQYQTNNRPGLDAAINEYKQQEQLLRGSEIFSDKGRFLLGRLNDIDDEYNSAFSDTMRYSFPMLSQDPAQMKNALAYINPAYGLGVGVLNGVGNILSLVKETGQKLTGFSWDNFDANSRNISYSLGEYKRFLETQGETGNYAFDMAMSIGEAFPQLVGHAAAAIAMPGIGSLSFIAATTLGSSMREAAAAGLNPMGQATYGVLDIALNYFSERITTEGSLLKSVRGKSVLTKELVENIMSPKTRKQAFKEYANLLWKKGAKTTWQGTLEAFEEEVANKGNFILQSFYNGMMNTSFNPNIGTAQESLDTLITMIGTSVLFKGAARLKQMTAGATPMQEAKKELQKQGMDKVNASIMATLTTSEGMARALDIVKKVESGQIKESELNLPVYENVRDVLIPAAMSLNFNPNLSMQQRTVAMDNMVKADGISQMVERGEITAEEAAPALQTYAQNAQKALRDVEYASTEFGINADEMKSMIYDFFGVADMASGKTGALDARTEEEIAQAPVAQADMTPLDRQGFINSLNEIYVTPETNNAVKTAAQTAIANSPETFIASEIQNTKNLIEKAKSDYELASSQGPASAQLARIDDLTDKLNDLETIKSRYLKSQQDATQISQGQQQEIPQPSNLLQRQGVEQGQPQVGQGEGGIGQATQQTADYRNSNFSGQARQANQEVRQIFADTGVTGAYTMPIQEGQEVEFMDSLAGQVAIDEPSVVSQLGQPVVDRVKQYMADTGFTSEMPVVRTAMQADRQRRVEQSRAKLIEALKSTDAAPVAANKKAVKSLVDRLKKAFPNVKVIMDKKGFQNALKDEAARDLMAKGGVVYGRVLNGEVYLNPDFANYNTPIHEFGHLWLSAAKEVAPKLYEKGLQLIRDSEYMAKLQGDPLYDNLSNEDLENEALATAIGDRGEQFVNDAQKDGFRNWMRRMLKKMAQYVGIFNLSNTEIDMLTLDEYLNRATASILAGEEISPASVRAIDITIGDGFMARVSGIKQQMTDLANDVMQRELSKGRTLEEAKIAAISEVSSTIIANATGKTNLKNIDTQVASIVDAVYRQQKDIQQGTVTMTTSEFIRNAVSNQIRAIKDVQDRAKKIEKAVKDILKDMSSRYGKGLQLSASQVNAIIKDINDNIFSREDIMSAVDNAAIEISKVIEKGYKKKVLQDTASLIDRLKSASKTKFAADFFVKVTEITDTDLSQLPNSTASLEDISKLNENIKRILDGKLEGIQDALNILNSISPTNQQIVANEHKSLLTKIKDLIKDAQNNTLTNLDYQKLLGLQKAIEDVKDRKGNIAALTPEQQAEIMQQYGILMLTPLGNINDVVAAKEADIQRETIALVEQAKNDIESETSDLRNKIPNGIMYQQFLRFLNALTDNYLSNLSPKELLNLSNALNSVMTYGNYSNVTYSEYVKAVRYRLKTEGREWGVGISARRNKINSTGLTGFVTSKFKNFARTFTDVEGATPSPDAIAKNLDLLKLTAIDYELYSGFDELNMGFLEREVFGPMAMAIDAAATKTQAKLGELQSAMLSFADKSNNDVIKKAIGDILKTYNLSGTMLGMSLIARLKKGYGGAIYADVSTRMAAIVAHQIDHISNPRKEGDPKDIVLARNILENNVEGKTMYTFFTSGGQSFSSLSGDYNKYIDAIAYAALTNSGRGTLADMNADELMNLLTEKQKEGIKSWREHINNNAELFEAAQVVTGNMKASIKNYFPRRVMSGNDIKSIADAENYINGQFENIGLNQGQLQSRSSNTGRLDLDGNRVLLNNMKALHLMNEVKPYLDYIKGLEDAIQDIQTDPKDSNEFAVAYLQGISKAAKNRLNASLMNNENAISDTFSLAYKGITAVQSIASRVWLISVSRQIIDFSANITSLASGLAFENKKFSNQIMRIFNPRDAKYKTDKGIYKWEDYVDIARFTGSPIYKVMSIYADNFLYEYKKTPEELQRQQRVGSWQDMAVKKRGWMSRFEEAFKRLSGEYLDHAAFKDERSVYHAVNLAFVERAVAAADSFVDRKFSLPSFSRQPLRRQMIFPFIGRGLRNLFKADRRFTTMAKDNPAGLITGFLQGYPTTQHQAFNSYMKLAFSTTSGLSLTERAKYFSRAVIEGMLPVFMYTTSRAYMGVIFMSSANAIMAAADDDEEMKKSFKELDTKEGWEKFLYKNKKAMESINDSAIEYIINSYASVAIDPQTNFLLRTSLGLTVFAYWKQKAITELDKMTNKKQVKQRKMQIRKTEDMWFKIFNLKPFVLYGGEDYDRAFLMHYERYSPGKATQDWEMLVNSIGGISILYDVISNTSNLTSLMKATDGKTEVDKTNALLAAGLQGYGLLFANIMLGGKLGVFANMISGDANKLGKYFMKEEMSKYKDEKRKDKGFLIEAGKSKRQKKRPGAPGGRGGRRAGAPKR